MAHGTGPRLPLAAQSIIESHSSDSSTSALTVSFTPKEYEQLLDAGTALASTQNITQFARVLFDISFTLSDVERAFFILDQDDAWLVAAGSVRTPPHFQVFSTLTLTNIHETGLLWVAPVLDAIRTQQAVIQQGTHSRARAGDRRPDILCVPLLSKGQATAILYLEKQNRATGGAGGQDAHASGGRFGAFGESSVHLAVRLADLAAPRLQNLLEMSRLAELVELRQGMTEALRASEERFRSIFNSSPVMIFLTDGQGRLLMVNEYWLQALGYTRIEVISRAIGEFCTPTGRSLLARQIAPRPQAGHQYENLPIQFVKRNGTLLDALVSGVILPSEAENYSQCLSFAIDVTARRRAEEELDRYRQRLEFLVRERTQELSAANRQLEQDIQRRKQAESQLRRSQQFLQATIDALSEKLAILDATGVVVALNSSWHDTQDAQAAYWQGYQAGNDYVAALKEQRAVEQVVIRQIEAGLQALSAGERNLFYLTYLLRAGGQENWYSLRAIRFRAGGETYIAVAHDDMTDRKQAEQALLEAAAVNERHRLARDLHDSVTQALYSIALFVDAIRLALSAGQVEQATQNLVDLRAMSREAMENMRALVFELHPPELAEIGLVGALREYLKNYQHRTQIATSYEITGVERALPLRVESELYRVAQEALTNCFKHAKAGQVQVLLDYGQTELELRIADNGQGFQPALAHLGGGMGLRGMQERIHSIGGQIDLESEPGQGTTVWVRMAHEENSSNE